MSQHSSRRAVLPALAITGLVAGLAVAAPASGATGSFANPAPITLADYDDDVYGINETDIALGSTAGPGSVYPSKIEVAAPAGSTVNFLSVDVDIVHERLDDVDLMLVGPTGKSAMLVSDVGGDNAYDGVLRVSAAYFGDSRFPDATTASFGSPTDWDTTPGDADAFPAPAPATASPDFDDLEGTPATGTWSLYAVDDTNGAVGTIRDWSIGLNVALPASPSPSAVAVTGLPSGITDVNLSLHDIDLAGLEYAEVVLESPDGRRAHVISDAGGDDTLTDVNLVLDDEAAEPLRRNEAPTSGTYRPVDYDAGDFSEFVGGADTRNLSSALSTFDGANPNGTWKLYVLQQYDGNPGAISRGWSLQITTADASATPVITSPANGTRDKDGTVTVTGTAKAGSLVRVAVGDRTRNTVAEGGAWTVTFDDLKDGSHTFTATATDASGNASAPASVTVVVDTVAPKVGKIKPKDKSRGVATSVSPKVKFSEAMKVRSLKRAVTLVTASGDKVKVKLRFKAGKNVLTINPRKDLKRNTTYTVVVKRSAKDLAGHKLRTSKKSSFRTT